MSIYASLPAPADDHEHGCAFYAEREPGLLEPSGAPCDCGQPQAPLVYQGSHVLPAAGDPRGGYVDLALIPGFISRDGADDDRVDSPPHPWLRVGIDEATVVLDVAGVERVHRTLGQWLASVRGGA